MSAKEVPPVDGRTARAHRTREAIVDACIELVDDGQLRPTAPRIAARAGVSVRSVFQHFDDLEGLFAAVADKAVSRMAELIVPVEAALAVGERIEQIVRRRALFLEVLTPMRRAAAVHAPFSAELTRRLQEGHDLVRRDVERVFATELDACGADERRALLDMLGAALSWSTWEDLRTLNHRTPDEAAKVTTALVARALGVPAPPPPKL